MDIPSYRYTITSELSYTRIIFLVSISTCWTIPSRQTNPLSINPIKINGTHRKTLTQVVKRPVIQIITRLDACLHVHKPQFALIAVLFTDAGVFGLIAIVACGAFGICKTLAHCVVAVVRNRADGDALSLMV